VLNLIVIVATPIEGGHHLVDVIAAVPVAVLAVFTARWISTLALRWEGGWALPGPSEDLASPTA
jgi:hypothetical protein